MSRRTLLLILATTMIAYACYVRAEQNPYARYVAVGYSVIDRWALIDTPDQELFEGAMRGMMDVLHEAGDDHSAFVDEQQHDQFQEGLSQEFGGIGVRIRLLGDPPVPTIVGPPEPGTPAFAADIRSGDQIISIDGKSTLGMEMLDVLYAMRGPVGQPIALSVLHEGETSPEYIQLERAMITIESIIGDLRTDKGLWDFRLAQVPRIAYLRITQFGDKTVAQLTRVLAELTEADSPVEALILDVRDNVGGALDAAVDICDLFLRAGKTIVTTRGRDEQMRDRFVSTEKGNYTDIPLAVLINHNSASASEILAACLQDHSRAVIVGQRSYGKGTVQRLMRIESGRSLLKLTSATYWRPSGQNIHRMPGDEISDTWGVRPTEGFKVDLGDEQYLQWRQYRRRRDILGEHLDGPLAEQFEAEDGVLPKAFTDEALDLAVQYLQEQI